MPSCACCLAVLSPRHAKLCCYVLYKQTRTWKWQIFPPTRCVPGTYKMINDHQCRTCLPWILLTSYAVLLVVGVLGSFMSVGNLGHEEMLSPTPSPQLESNATTTTPQHYYSRNELGVPEAYKEYVYASRNLADASNDARLHLARLYVLLPCVVVAALVVVCGLCSRQFFCYTFSLYNSLCLWVLTLTWIIIYQTKAAWESRMPLDNVGWVELVHVVLMLLLSVQILLCVWELRLKKAGWPTFNYRSLLTAEALLLTARLTLTVCTLVSLSGAQVFRGFRGQRNPSYDGFYGSPNIKYPLLFTLICCTTACYNAVATLETLLSMLVGKLHTCLTALTTLLSAACCVTVAVFCSPVIIKMVISPQYLDVETMYLSIGLSVVTFLHLIACIAFPTASRTPPAFLSKMVSRLVSEISNIGNVVIRENVLDSAFLQRKGKLYITTNFISVIFSIFSINITTVVMLDPPLYRAWGSVMVLCANSATLVRTLPPAVMQLRFKKMDNIPVNQRVIGMSLECAALLVGAIAKIAMCNIRCYSGGEIIVVVMNLLFFGFQIFIIVHMLKGKYASEQSEDTERPKEIDEVSITSQGRDYEQDSNDLSA